LRITAGKNNGNSPGSPYVIEIWPPGCKSSIHEHGNSFAIIKVLHGAIHEELYPSLAFAKEGQPFTDKIVYKKGDVTYKTPELN